MDECRTSVNDCSENANCSNTEGSYDCACHDGFIGNGIICLSRSIKISNFTVVIKFSLLFNVDNTDCRILNCSQLCINTTGSLTCACHPGYFLNTNLRECEGILGCIDSLHVHS